MKDWRDIVGYACVAGMLALCLYVLAVHCGCVPIKASPEIATKKQQVDQGATQRGDNNRITNVAVQVGEWAPWAACGLFGLASWRGRRYRQVADRLVKGIEECGADCSAKHHAKGFGDSVETYLHGRVRSLTKRKESK